MHEVLKKVGERLDDTENEEIPPFLFLEDMEELV